MGGIQEVYKSEEENLSSSGEVDSLLPLAHKREDFNATKTDAFILSLPNFIPSFEGLRGLAVLGTCANHALPGFMQRLSLICGRIGIQIFFVMSGFLVTGILAGQQQITQRADKGRYAHLQYCYKNRLVRLYPALLLMVTSTALLQYIVTDGKMPFGYKNNMANALLYLCNFEPFGPHYASIWKNTYSIANQEQWYLFWSLLLPILLTISHRRRIRLVCLLIAVSLFGRLCNDFGWYKLRIFRWDGLLAGIVGPQIGALLRLLPASRKLLSRRVGWAGVALLALQLLDAVYGNDKPLKRLGLNPNYFGFEGYTHFTSIIVAVCLIMGSVKGLWLFETQLLRFLGRISYSFYLYQIPLILMMGWPRGYVAVAYTCVAFSIAMFSTLYVEEPFANWNRNKRKPDASLRASRD